MLELDIVNILNIVHRERNNGHSRFSLDSQMQYLYGKLNVILFITEPRNLGREHLRKVFESPFAVMELLYNGFLATPSY